MIRTATINSPAGYGRALPAGHHRQPAVQPESKLNVWDRWLETIYLPSCSGLKLWHMYLAMDMLYAHAVEVEKTVFFHTTNLLTVSAYQDPCENLRAGADDRTHCRAHLQQALASNPLQLETLNVDTR